MDQEIRDFYASYYCKASNWVEEISPNFDATITDTILGLPPNPIMDGIAKLSKPFAIKASRYTVDKIAQQVKNPQPCVDTPGSYRILSDVQKLDFVWIDMILKGRTKDYDEVHSRLRDGAKELEQVSPCYSPNSMAEAVLSIL